MSLFFSSKPLFANLCPFFLHMKSAELTHPVKARQDQRFWNFKKIPAFCELLINVENILKGFPFINVFNIRIAFPGGFWWSGWKWSSHVRSVLLVWCEPLDTSFSSSSAPAGCSATSPFFPPLLGSAGTRPRTYPSLHPHHLYRERTLYLLWDLQLPRLHRRHHGGFTIFVTVLFVIIVI